MIEQKGTYDRLVKAIEEGATIRFLCGGDFEGGVYDLNAWIVKNDQRLEIDLKLANRVIKHPDICEGYAGYRSDYARKWEHMFEHKHAPKPRWVTEQWGWDEETGALIK